MKTKILILLIIGLILLMGIYFIFSEIVFDSNDKTDYSNIDANIKYGDNIQRIPSLPGGE